MESEFTQLTIKHSNERLNQTTSNIEYANTFANMPCENIMKGYERLPPMMKGYERYSKVLRTWRKNSLKRVLSLSREY